MITDPIIEELHRVREEIAAQFNYDVFAIGAALRAKQQEEDWPVVSFAEPTNEAEDQPKDQPVEKAA